MARAAKSLAKPTTSKPETEPITDERITDSDPRQDLDSAPALLLATHAARTAADWRVLASVVARKVNMEILISWLVPKIRDWMFDGQHHYIRW